MNRKEKVQILIAGIAVVAAVILLYAGVRLWETRDSRAEAAKSAEEVQTEEQPVSKKKVKINGHKYTLEHKVKTYLIMGTDASGSEEASGEEYQGSMADFLLLLVIDDQEKSYGFIQLNRDTMTDVPLMNADGTANASAKIQLCTAHWYGGSKELSCENTANAVTDLIGGIPVNGYYALKMDAIGLFNHEVGGVTVTIEDDFTGEDESMYIGASVTLTDEQAELFTTARMGIGDGENVSRMRRQRAYMEAFFDKAGELAEADAQFAVTFLEDLEDYATTDIKPGVWANSVQKTQSYTSKGMFVPEGEAQLGQALGDGLDHTEFYMDPSSLEEILLALYPLERVE
jgi:anionic cell wall polymer biosynthesis LytR-Cps2A-Psr (LCP) family protein